MKIEFESDSPQLLALLNELADRVEPAATASALNSAGNKVRQWAVSEASKRTGVPAKILRRRIAIPRSRKATKSNPSLIIFGGLWPVPVDQLRPAPRELKSGSVKYKTMNGQAPNPSAFMAPYRHGGGRSVFVRKGRSRLPIKKITAEIGPHVRFSLIKTVRSKEAKAYFRRMFYSQMDRKVVGAMRRKGIKLA